MSGVNVIEGDVTIRDSSGDERGVLNSPIRTALDPGKQVVLSDATVTSSGSTIINAFGEGTIALFINITDAPTGTSPSIQFTVAEVDPGDETTVISPVNSRSGSAITAAGQQRISILATGPIKVSWEVTGTTPSFTGVYATIINKQTSMLVVGLDDFFQAQPIRWRDDRLRVDVGEVPVNVVLTSGTQSYYHTKLVASDVPATIETGATEPYAVGNTTLTIDVDAGGDQTCDFPTRVALAGIHYSAPYPATSNPDTEKLKVSVDGGALLEVKTGKGLTSADDIAAALQAQIRANVENGSGVTVEYDTAEYPFRYVFKSGTTGASSSMHVEKGGDDLAKNIFVGAFGGTERIGLAADSYWAFEVVSELDSQITDTLNSVTAGGKIDIQTVAGGASASLEVTAGGANAALQFPTTLTTGVTGSGSDDMTVDGSSSSVRYAIDPPSSTFVVQKLEFFIRDDGATLKRWGGLNELTNGVKIQLKPENTELISDVEVTTNADLITQADDGEIVADAFDTGGQDLVKAVFDFGSGFRVVPGGSSNVYVTVQDNLTAIDQMYVRARGVIET